MRPATVGKASYEQQPWGTADSCLTLYQRVWVVDLSGKWHAEMGIQVDYTGPPDKGCLPAPTTTWPLGNLPVTSRPSYDLMLDELVHALKSAMRAALPLFAWAACIIDTPA